MTLHQFLIDYFWPVFIILAVVVAIETGLRFHLRKQRNDNVFTAKHPDYKRAIENLKKGENDDDTCY